MSKFSPSTTSGGSFHFVAVAVCRALAVQVGPATDEAGKLRVADYADCGFGSSGTAPAPGGGGPGAGELPATAVEVESAVLEHFPEEQREDAPFPTKVCLVLQQYTSVVG